MEKIELFGVIVSAIFIGGFCLGVFAYGLNEAGKHTDDETMPRWAWACLTAPLVFVLICFVLTVR